MAIYRGFCVMNCWSPLNIMTAVVSTAVPAAPMPMLLPIAFMVAVGMAALGWLEDRLSAARRATRAPSAATDPWSIHLGIIALVGLVMLQALEGVAAAAHGHLPGGRRHAGGALRRHRMAAGPATPPEDRPDPADAGPAAGPLSPAHPGVPRRAQPCSPPPAARPSRWPVRWPAEGLAPLLAWLPPLALPLLVPVVLIGSGQIGLNPVAVVALLGVPRCRTRPRSACCPAALAFAFMLSWGPGVGYDPDVCQRHHHCALGRCRAVDRQHGVERRVYFFCAAARLGRHRRTFSPGAVSAGVGGIRDRVTLARWPAAGVIAFRSSQVLTGLVDALGSGAVVTPHCLTSRVRSLNVAYRSTAKLTVKILVPESGRRTNPLRGIGAGFDGRVVAPLVCLD